MAGPTPRRTASQRSTSVSTSRRSPGTAVDAELHGAAGAVGGARARAEAGVERDAGARGQQRGADAGGVGDETARRLARQPRGRRPSSVGAQRRQVADERRHATSGRRRQPAARASVEPAAAVGVPAGARSPVARARHVVASPRPRPRRRPPAARAARDGVEGEGRESAGAGAAGAGGEPRLAAVERLDRHQRRPSRLRVRSLMCDILAHRRCRAGPARSPAARIGARRDRRVEGGAVDARGEQRQAARLLVPARRRACCARACCC